MGKKRIIKPVSFNVNDEYERRLFEYATDKERGMFSRYIKRLIALDRDGELARNSVVSPAVMPESNEDEDADAMAGYF